MDPSTFAAAFALGRDPASKPATPPEPPAIVKPADASPNPLIRYTPRDPESPAQFDPTATTKVLDPPPSHTAPAPINVQFHENAATKDDINALGSKLDAMLTPLDHRLAAVERKTDDLSRDVTALKLARATPAPKAPAPPPTLWELYDATGVRCTGHDREELIARVQQRNAWFAAQATRQRVVEPAPMFALPSLGLGGYPGSPWTPSDPTYGSGEGQRLFYGGMGVSTYGSMGCAGGSCR